MKYSNRKCFNIKIILILCIVFFTGCSTKPTFYSKEEITEYVKNVFGKEYKLVKEEDNSYTFRDKKGLSFTATTYSQNVTFDASETSFYEKNFYTNYVEQVVEFHADEIQELLNKYDFKLDNHDNYYFNIYIKDTDQFEQLSKFISELDNILAYKINNSNIPEKMSKYDVDALRINIYMEDIELSSFNLSSDEDERLEPDQIYEGIEWAYVEAVRAGSIDDKVDKELYNKYPSYSIKPVYFNGEPLSIEFDDFSRDYEDTYTLYYDYNMGTYTMLYLDPCQDFKDFPYTYSGVGTFKHLVELLGGTYSCDDWKASWEIGENIWKATLHTKTVDGSKSSYDYLEVSRNGVPLELSEGINTPGNGSVSGREYTLKDLELMLDISIEVDQVNMVANISRND